MGVALTQAKYLSGLFGSTSPDGWPVVWSNGLCSIFYPPARGRLIVTAITSWARYVNIEGTTREGGIQLCAPLWPRFYRIGDIPIPTRYFAEASSINLFRSLVYGLGCLQVVMKFLLQSAGLGRFRIFQPPPPR